jgi:hypothetical protein
MPMSVETWLARVAADRPKLSDAQIAALRPVLAPIARRIQENAAPACMQERRPETAETEPSWKDTA